MAHRRVFAALALAAYLGLAPPAVADTLWTANDLGPTQAVYNLDLKGNVLRTIPNTPANGVAVDLASNTLYIATPDFSTITSYSLTTLTPNGKPISRPVSEDLAFDGTHIVSADYSSGTLDRINPATGMIDSSITIGGLPLGVSLDGGTGFWVSDFGTAMVTHYDSLGNPLSSFASPSARGGGLAYDTTDGTLWIGDFGQVFHYTTAGVNLGDGFAVPTPDLVDGLEFQAGPSVIPEPASLICLGIGAGTLLTYGWRRRRLSA
jgi:hypothetical protein